MRAITIVPQTLLHTAVNDDMHMCLYQEMKKGGQYAKFYMEQIALGKFVIMDNGAAEGVNPTIQELIPAYEQFLPSEAVLPDVVGEMQNTIDRTLDAYHQLVQLGLATEMQLMAVPQGQTFEEWTTCLEVMLQLPRVTTIGISKFVTKLFAEEMGEGANVRMECLDYVVNRCNELEREIQIHLLGCYDDVAELQQIAESSLGQYVRSTDSAIAYVHARKGVNMWGKRPDQDHIDFVVGDEVCLQLFEDNKYDWRLRCGWEGEGA